MSCDVCGTTSGSISELRSDLCSPVFSHICSNCNREYVQRKFDFTSAFTGQIVLQVMREEHFAARKRSLRERFKGLFTSQTKRDLALTVARLTATLRAERTNAKGIK